MKKILLTIVLALGALVANAADSYYFQRAEEAYQKNDLDACLRFCQEGIKDNPKDGKCWAVIAEIYSKRQYAKYGQALQAAEKALSALPKKETYWRAFVHNIRGNVYYKIEDLASAKEAYTASVALQPENASFLYELADVCFDLQQYGEAITYYKRCVEISPKLVYVYAEMAYAYYLSGDKEEAQRYCDLTNALSSERNCTTHRVLSRLAVDKGDLALACRETARAMFCGEGWCQEADTLKMLCPDLLLAAIRYEVAKAPTDVQTNATAAYCAFSMQRYDETLYYLHRKLEQSEEPQQIYSELGAVYDDIEAYEESEKYYAMVMKNDSSADVLSNWASIVRHRGEWLRAEELYRRAIKEKPDDGLPYYWIARMRKEQGDWTGALQALDTAQVLLEDEERQISMHHLRAEIYRAQGKEELAQQALHQAQRMRKDLDERPAFYIVDALLGDTAALNRRFDSIMQVRNGDSDPIMDLASAYAVLQDKAHVMALLERYGEAGVNTVFIPRTSSRFDFLRGDADFEQWMTQETAKQQAALAKLKARLGERDKAGSVAELPFTLQGGVCRVKCAINGLPLYFVFDTGAADVSISSVEANFMLKNGYLTNADFLGKQNYVSATGEIHEGTVINLREVRVGDVVLRDIKASVIKHQSAPLLLGQSCFRRFGTVEVDNTAQVIRLLQ